MATRADLRAMVRSRLEDTGGTPLWDDDTLNGVMADGLSQYGVRFPLEKTVSVAVTDGDTNVAVVPDLEGTQVVQVRDPEGEPVEQIRSNFSGANEIQSWRWWASSLVFSRPAIGGTWRIDYLAPRTMPGDDVTTIEIRSGDEEIVVLLSAAAALMRRSVEQGKRGLERAGVALAKVAEMHACEAERLMAARRRRAWGGWVES